MSWLLASAVGVAAGIMASMGLGGGFVLLVYLTLFTATEQMQAQGINLLFFIPIITVSVAIHLKNKLIDVKTALICGGIGAVFVFVGYFAARAFEGDILRKAFAVFIILAGMKELFSKSKKNKA